MFVPMPGTDPSNARPEPLEQPFSRCPPSLRSRRGSDRIPLACFAVQDVGTESERLKGLGVRFTHGATEMGQVTTAVFDDTCGNLILSNATPGPPASRAA